MQFDFGASLKGSFPPNHHCGTSVLDAVSHRLTKSLRQTQLACIFTNFLGITDASSHDLWLDSSSVLAVEPGTN